MPSVSGYLNVNCIAAAFFWGFFPLFPFHLSGFNIGSFNIGNTEVFKSMFSYSSHMKNVTVNL